MMMETWFANVLRYSRRDQLSLLVMLQNQTQSHYSRLNLDNHLSEFHEWPITSNSRSTLYFENFFDHYGLAERDSAIAERDSAIAERDSAIAVNKVITDSNTWKFFGWYRYFVRSL